MQRTDTLIIGGGQAGLAMSRCLRERGIDHVVLERGRIAERWRSERWDSLRLLTPNWLSRLPGFSYRGPDPDGFMRMPEVVDYLTGYADSFAAPVETGTTVEAVAAAADGYRVTTDRGGWLARNVVVATGHCDRPAIPPFAGALADDYLQLSPTRYRRPQQLPAAEVLIVGASASGLQLADEIRRSGRAVTLAVGRHTRLPRRYRGRDILWWLDRLGILAETTEKIPDLEASRRQPSLQLVGRPDHAQLDLETLQQTGVRLVGRAVSAERHRLHFADDLEASIAAADRKLDRLLARIDRFAATDLADAKIPPPTRLPPIELPDAPATLDLRTARIGTVIWATGFNRRYPWLEVPVLDRRGEIRHEGGVTPAGGLYVLGLRLLRSRKSSFLDGVGDDARELASNIAARLRHPATAVA